jgi:hypothetical protein
VLLGSTAFNNEFERLTTGSGVEAEEASLAMSPAGDTLYSVWAQQASGVHEARYARVWYTDANFTPTTPPIGSGDDEPVIGDGGTTPTPPPVDDGDEDPADEGGGCTASTSQRPVDPVLPLIAALGLAGWAMRRRARRNH